MEEIKPRKNKIGVLLRGLRGSQLREAGGFTCKDLVCTASAWESPIPLVDLLAC